MIEVLTGLAKAIGNVFLTMGTIIFEFGKAIYNSIMNLFE